MIRLLLLLVLSFNGTLSFAQNVSNETDEGAVSEEAGPDSGGYLIDHRHLYPEPTQSAQGDDPCVTYTNVQSAAAMQSDVKRSESSNESKKKRDYPGCE
jgi:hypothetical protein